MLAASVDPVLIVVLVIAALLLLLTAVGWRRRSIGQATEKQPQTGSDREAPVASPDTGLTLPSVERSDGSAPHGATGTVEPTTTAPHVAPVTDTPKTPEPVSPPEDMWERTHRTRSLFGDAFRRIRSR